MAKREPHTNDRFSPENVGTPPPGFRADNNKTSQPKSGKGKTEEKSPKNDKGRNR